MSIAPSRGPSKLRVQKSATVSATASAAFTVAAAPAAAPAATPAPAKTGSAGLAGGSAGRDAPLALLGLAAAGALVLGARRARPTPRSGPGQTL